MSGSQEYLEGLGGEIRTWDQAIRELHAEFGSKASGILAKAFGKTQRTGERWIAMAEGRTSQKSDPTRRNPERARELINVVRARRAARRMRAARRVRAGRVRVVSKSPKKPARDPRPRNIGTLTVSGDLADGIDRAAELVEQGDYAGASQVLDDAVLDAYGVPEGVLGIEDYEDGISLE